MDTQQDLPNCSWQSEIAQSSKVAEDAICLFGQFVVAVSPNALENIQSQLKFSAFVRDMCVKAPSIAQYLVKKIDKYTGNDPQSVAYGSMGCGPGTDSKQSSGRRKLLDRTYPPPKSSRAQLGTRRDTIEILYGDTSGSSLVGDDAIPIQSYYGDVAINQGSDRLLTDSPVPQYKGKISEATTKGARQEGVQSQSLLSEVQVQQQETTLREANGKALDAQASFSPSLPCGSEPQDSAPFTPTKRIGIELQSPSSNDETVTPDALFTPTGTCEALSPLTEDDRTVLPNKTELISLQRILSPPSTTALAQKVDKEQSAPIKGSLIVQHPSPLEEAPTLVDSVAKVIQIIHDMCRRQEAPMDAHSEILNTLRSNLVTTPDTTPTAWSGPTIISSLWINLLDTGHARFKEATILNMIEWMGASVWYDAELEQAKKASLHTKRGLVRKRVATIVLDKYLKESRDTIAIESPAKCALSQNGHDSLLQNSGGVQERILSTRRKKLTKIFHRGRVLRILVQATSFGVLFDPNIWSYAKASKEDIDKVAILFQADPQKMKLLFVLDEQVELLVKKGRPDLSRFLGGLESHSIIPVEEVVSLRAEYGSEREPIPESYLRSSLNRVVEGVRHILGKRTFGDNDSIIVNGAVELSCGMFDRLRSKQWLNCWDIAATLEMADRPTFVRLGLSVPLHKEANGEITLLPKPLHYWRENIDNYKRQGKNDPEDLYIYLCPLNIYTNHFTLLEINEQTRMISHYDSMAKDGVICRKTKSVVRREVEGEFKHLGFGYTEAPCPQQRDNWSCGLMVIRNAKRRMMGLPIGSWTDEVAPDRVVCEILQNCQTFLDSDAIQQDRFSKKRKRIAEGLRGDVLKASRSSKRLKEIKGGLPSTT